MKHVKCKSGIQGWQCRLQKNYADFEEFEQYAELRDLHTRIGYATPKDAWLANPLIQGSVIPDDFCKVSN